MTTQVPIGQNCATTEAALRRSCRTAYRCWPDSWIAAGVFFALKTSRQGSRRKPSRGARRVGRARIAGRKPLPSRPLRNSLCAAVEGAQHEQTRVSTIAVATRMVKSAASTATLSSVRCVRFMGMVLRPGIRKPRN
jgi:hypothetical protein